MLSIDKTITAFLEDLENNKKRSWRAVRNYDLYLRRFGGWLRKNKIEQFENITKEDIKKYQAWLAQNRLVHGLIKLQGKTKNNKLKSNTQNYHLIAVRALLNFLAKKKIKTLPPGEIELKATPAARINYLQKSDLEKLLETPIKIKQDKIIQFRDKAILELLYCSGLKVSELASLKIADFDLKSGTIKIAGRAIKLSNMCRYWLHQYRNLCQAKTDNFFIGLDRAQQNNSNGLSVRSVERIVARYAKIVGIKTIVTPHVLRHTFARNFILSGNKLSELQKRLGYTAMSTVKRYLI
ncbi:MAG: tyrosine-type recombinase/integrase [Parcubacteria group bacterium]